MLFHYLCSAYALQCRRCVVSGFITWNALMNYSDPETFFFFLPPPFCDRFHPFHIVYYNAFHLAGLLQHSGSIHQESGGCYYNLIWVIWCLTFTVIWCITLIWCSAQHRVYNRNSMTASHKIAISNLIYFHQYLLTHYESRVLHVFFFPSLSPQNLAGRFQRVPFFPFSFYEHSSKNLYYPFRPVSKSQAAIVVWITSDKTSPLCLPCCWVCSGHVCSLSLPIKCTHTHWYYRESDFNRRCWLHANRLVRIFICAAWRSDICFP